jgi:hypothetical protein
MRKLFSIGLAVLAVLAIASCGIGTDKATVTFQTSNSVPLRSVTTVDLTCEHYAIHGVGLAGLCEGATFDLDIAGTSGSASIDLAQGTWLFTSKVWNADVPSKDIGHASVTQTITAGTPATVTLVNLPYTGDGTVSMTMGWVPAVVVNPGVEVEFLQGATLRTMDVTMDSNVAAHGSIVLPSGWHTGFMRILDSEALSAGCVRAVRVLANETTTWDEFFTVAALEGGVTFDASWFPGQPLVLTTNPAPGVFPVYSGHVYDFTVTGADVSLVGATFAWYINGDATAVGASATYALDADTLTVDRPYYVSALVFLPDGSRAGDAQWVVTKHSTTAEQFDVSGTATNTGGGYSALEWRVWLHDWTTDEGMYMVVMPAPGLTRPWSFTGLAAGTYRIEVSAIGGGAFIWPDPLVIPNSVPGAQTVDVSGNMP